jgi:NADH dehydrogenase
VLRREMKRGNLTVLQAEVTASTSPRARSLLDAGQSLAYDHLIVAAGATHSYFGHDDWATHAPGPEDAGRRLRDPLARDRRFERAERCTDAAHASRG